MTVQGWGLSSSFFTGGSGETYKQKTCPCPSSSAQSQTSDSRKPMVTPFLASWLTEHVEPGCSHVVRCVLGLVHIPGQHV